MGTIDCLENPLFETPDGRVPTTDGLAWLPPFLRPAFLRPTLWREAIVANASIEPWENVGDPLFKPIRGITALFHYNRTIGYPLRIAP